MDRHVPTEPIEPRDETQIKEANSEKSQSSETSPLIELPFTITGWGEKIPHDLIENEIKRIAPYVSDHELYPQRVAYWQSKAESYLIVNGDSFDRYVKGLESLVSDGIEIMVKSESTGFNIDKIDVTPLGGIYSSVDMISIFYNCSINRPEHVGLLLAFLEKKRLISEDQITLGTKATKVIWEWQDVSHTQPEQLVREDGQKMDVASTVELVIKIAFDSDSDTKIAGVLKFLQEYAFAQRPDSIPASWDVPDIRIIAPELQRAWLNELLQDPIIAENYTTAKQNVLEKDGGRILVLREDTMFDGWNTESIGINKTLKEFLGILGVGK